MLIAIDPSLTASGWASFSLSSGLPQAVGVIKPPGPSLPLAKRLDWLQEEVNELYESLQFGSDGILICEGPAPLVHNPQSALKVERVRGIFEAVARSKGALVPGRLNPRTVQTELLGMRGKQIRRADVKPWARETALRLYGPQLQALDICGQTRLPTGEIPQDVIDALLIGALAVAKVKFCINHGLDIGQEFLPRARLLRERRSDRYRVHWNERDVEKLSVK